VRITHTKVALIALAVAATTLAGCQADTPDPVRPGASSAPAAAGIAALSADEILQRAKAALTKAKSYQIKGELEQDDENIAFDLKVSGADSIGSMSIGTAKLELLTVGGKKYMRPNKQFWITTMGPKQGPTVAKAIGDHWVAGADKDQSFAEIFTMTSVDQLLRPTGALSKGEEKVVGGVAAIGLKDGGDPDSMFYVATTGEPYPLQMTSKGRNLMVFSDFGATFTGIEAPAENQILDLGKLAGK
jgi:hypothetical protein